MSFYPPEHGTGGGCACWTCDRLLSEQVEGLSLTLITRDHGAPLEPELASIFERVVQLPVERFNEDGIVDSGVLDGDFDAVDPQCLQSGDLAGFFQRRGILRSSSPWWSPTSEPSPWRCVMRDFLRAEQALVVVGRASCTA